MLLEAFLFCLRNNPLAGMFCWLRQNPSASLPSDFVANKKQGQGDCSYYNTWLCFCLAKGVSYWLRRFSRFC